MTPGAVGATGQTDHGAGGSVVVTGAASGIGRATVRHLVQRDRAVALLDIDAVAGEAFADELRGSGRRCLFVATDVTDESSVLAAARQVADELGPVSGLVNNAGGFESHQAPGDVSLDAWTEGLHKNLTSAFLCTRAFLPSLREAGGGSIVNVSSLAARIGLPGISFVYSAAKAGLLGLTRQLAMDLADDRIRVNAVAPGMVGTDRLRRVHGDNLPLLEAEVPWGRVAEPAEIATVIEFLLGPASEYVTGATLDANGGRFAL